MLTTRRKPLSLLAALAIALLLAGGGALYLASANQQAAQAAERSQQAKSRLSTDLKAAQAAGYTQEDLAGITSQMGSVEGGSAPLWPGDRIKVYNQRTVRAQQLDADLKQRQLQLLQSAQEDAARQTVADRSALDHGRQIGVDDPTLAPLQQRLDSLAQAQGSAHTVVEYRTVSQQAQALNKDIGEVNAVQEKETQLLTSGGAQLKDQSGGNVDALRKTGQDAIAAGNNDASIAAFLNKPHQFKGWAAVSAAYARMQKQSGNLSSGDLNQVAVAAFATQRYSGQIHEALMTNLPGKTIVLSMQGQQLWAYENGREVAATAVTTGKPPDLATDVGPMKVLSKSSPWKMHSPWPKGSPFWYPDATVQMVVWFSNTGEGLHDAYWQNTPYGPGSQYGPSASHGCVHVPVNTERMLFNWSSIGTPVIVYPGDGQPVDKQLAQITTDDQGNPTTGPKGA